MKRGIAMNIAAFNIYIAPVLEFVAQLCLIDDRVAAAMRWALRTLASGLWQLNNIGGVIAASQRPMRVIITAGLRRVWVRVV